MSRLEEITEYILPTVASSGRVGPGAKFVKCKFDSATGEAQFASSVYFVEAEFQYENGTRHQPLLVKYNMTDELARNWLNLDSQFKNEVKTYETVLPYLDKDGEINKIFPKFLIGSTESIYPEKFFIVLEDLRSSGYKLTKEILDLDFEHCVLAFRKLGAFHALSFAAKKFNRDGFFDVVDNLVETRLFDHNCPDDEYLFNGSVNRAAEPLLKIGTNIDQIKLFQNKIKAPTEYFRKLFKVQEPMGVICHGDFCRNNVLYKYNESGNPIDIKLFDLAHTRYGSPMLDFTFFLLLNCSEESRKLHREQYLKIYHDALSSAMPGVSVPSLDDFKEEFRLKAVYGFLHCAFFKPAMMESEPFNPVVEVRKPLQERASSTLSKGGERGTATISAMLNELIELKCVL